MSSPQTSAERATARPPLSGPVVVGFDGSAAADDALVLGRQLADLTGQPLVVALVEPLELYVAPDPILVADLDAAQYEQADTVMARAAALLMGEEGRDWRRSVVAARSPALGLHRVIHRTDAGIVVLGRTHRHGAARAVPGTTAARLLHGSPCPVAIAPPRWASTPRDVERVSAGIDGSPESRAALHLAAALAAQAGASLQAVTAYGRPNPADPAYALTTKGYREAMADLRTLVEQQLHDAVAALPDVAADEVVIEGRPAEALARHARDRDLLVVGSRAYGPVRSVVVGDVAMALAADAPCALIVVPRGAPDA